MLILSSFLQPIPVSWADFETVILHLIFGEAFTRNLLRAGRREQSSVKLCQLLYDRHCYLLRQERALPTILRAFCRIPYLVDLRHPMLPYGEDRAQCDSPGC